MQTALQNLRFTVRQAGEWLLVTEQGHAALTLIIAFLIPWAMFA